MLRVYIHVCTYIQKYLLLIPIIIYVSLILKLFFCPVHEHIEAKLSVKIALKVLRRKSFSFFPPISNTLLTYKKICYTIDIIIKIINIIFKNNKRNLYKI